MLDFKELIAAALQTSEISSGVGKASWEKCTAKAVALESFWSERSTCTSFLDLGASGICMGATSDDGLHKSKRKQVVRRPDSFLDAAAAISGESVLEWSCTSEATFSGYINKNTEI
jgi:hypothetical protein